MLLLRVGTLPDEALAASARFHAQDLPHVIDALSQGSDLVLVFGPADHTHWDWRNGVLRSLARQFAPVRINGIAGDDEPAIAAAVDYLARAPGVTGQLLPVDGTGAGPMLYQG